MTNRAAEFTARRAAQQRKLDAWRARGEHLLEHGSYDEIERMQSSVARLQNDIETLTSLIEIENLNR